MLHEAQHVAGVAVLVVVPGHDLDEGAIEGDAGFGVEGRGCAVADEVGGHYLLVGVAEHALEFAFRGLLHGRADLLVGGFLVELDGQVDHGHVRGRHAERHAGEFLVQLRQHLADGLGGAGRGRDDVFQNTAAAAPVLAGRAVDGLLRGRGGVHGGHQAALDAEVVVQHLGGRVQTVGGAGGGRDDGLAGVSLVIYAVHEHRRIVLRRRRLHDLLGAGLDVGLTGFGGQEEAGGVDDDVGARFVPLEISRIFLGGQTNLLAIHHHAAAVDLDVAVEAAMHRVVLQNISQIVWFQQVVDGDDLDVFEIFRDRAEHHTTDTAETVNTDFDSHY